MKIKSIIETVNFRYAVLDDIDTIFNKMNDPYFFSDTFFSKKTESDFPCFSSALADIESNIFHKNINEDPEYIIGHIPVIFNTSKIKLVHPISIDISEVDE
jgi:hypothetical protein